MLGIADSVARSAEQGFKPGSAVIILANNDRLRKQCVATHLRRSLNYREGRRRDDARKCPARNGKSSTVFDIRDAHSQVSYRSRRETKRDYAILGEFTGRPVQQLRGCVRNFVAKTAVHGKKNSVESIESANNWSKSVCLDSNIVEA